MDEEKKTGLADAVETGASAAHTIKGAIKAGKAISGAAKGAAAGGPYGAVAGAVWAGRKHIGKIIAVIIILLLLPVLFTLQNWLTPQRFRIGRKRKCTSIIIPAFLLRV